MDGFKGFVALGDRQSGKLLGVAFWESEEALRATTAKFTGGWKIQPAEVLTSGQGFGVWATMPCGRTCQGRRWGMVRTLIIVVVFLVVVFLLMQLF
jgi:hypothetical protein